MTTWNHIDGLDQTTWTFVPLRIVEDLKAIPAAVAARFPAGRRDESFWTAAITSARTVETNLETDGLVWVAA